MLVVLVVLVALVALVALVDTTYRPRPTTNRVPAKHHSCQPPFIVETLECAAACRNASHRRFESEAKTRVDPACGAAGSTW